MSHRFENTPFKHEEVGYTLKVVNGPRFVSGPTPVASQIPFASVRGTVGGFVPPPKTVGSCYQVSTPEGNVLMKAWTPSYYNPPLAYDRCETPRPFGPRPTGNGGCKCGQSGLNCGCGGGGSCESSCGCGCNDNTPAPDDSTPGQSSSCGCTGGINTVSGCGCNSTRSGCQTCDPVMMGYAGESDSELGPSYRNEKYQSGYFAPQYVNGIRMVGKPRLVSGMRPVAPPTVGKLCMQQPCRMEPTQINYLRSEPRANTLLFAPGSTGSCPSQGPVNMQQSYGCKMDAFQEARDCQACPRQFQGYWNPWGQVNGYFGR